MTHRGTLFEDRFDGLVDPDWRIRPVVQIEHPVHGSVLHLKEGDPNAGPWLGWAGNDSWRNYRVELEVLPEGRGFVGFDFHVRDNESGCCNLHFPASPEGERRIFEGCGRWGDANTSWKLGPLSQRTAVARPGEWMRLRLDVGGAIANLFVDDATEPVFTVYDLPFDRGGIRLWRYRASAFFRNLRVTELGSVKPILEDVWERVVSPGVVRDWKLSSMLPPVAGADDAVVAARVEDTAARFKYMASLDEGAAALNEKAVWRDAEIDRRGVVNVIATDPGEYCREGVVLARTNIESAAEATRKMRLTYTDQLSMWLNREPVFVGERRGWNDPGRSEADGWGRLVPDQFGTELPLRPGVNEILVRHEVNEPLFGSGFWARLL